MSSTEEARDPTSNDEVRQAYQQMVQSRKAYRRASGTHFEDNAHESFHDAVFDLYDELRARLKRRDVTQDLWEEEKLWPTEPVYQPVAICEECGSYLPADELKESQLDVGDYCPNCARDNPDRAGRPRLKGEQIPKTDDEGQIVYNYVEGLRSLDQIRNRVEEYTVEYSDALGTHEEVRTQRQLIAPQRLEAVADLLAESMEILGLFPDAELSNDFELDEVR